MTRIILFTAFFLATLAAAAQVTENRNLSGFSKIEVATGVELIYTQSANTSLKVAAETAEQLQAITTEVSGNTLKIKITIPENQKGKKRNKQWNNFKNAKVYLSHPAITDFKASSSATIRFENEVAVKQLQLEVSSSGSIYGSVKCTGATIAISSSGTLKSNLNADKATVKMSSSATASLSGKVNNLTLEASSSSSFEAKKLEAVNASIMTSSSADATITVSGHLNAEATSSSSINYYGNATADVTKSSSGSVSKK
ncbi:head GIN domain-containing protein [Flavobacterium kingsejongi]|uniref:Putative auto-transporter adhesin head GIN domain-containing protein n=1 Tax=Flavobacterium kingsejongi TaxID=1678728 RepID=A0A2S1LMN6_9FLAO|nr:head GIN domain-containing protein [Flavobacterium kingsejongi]AWG24979.1 hypothetical protein FK004_06915 [Flavobacterium kingsejongi]